MCNCFKLISQYPDTVTINTNPGPNGAQLHVGVAFKNVSKADFTALGLKVMLTDSTNRTITYPVNNLRALPAGDSSRSQP